MLLMEIIWPVHICSIILAITIIVHVNQKKSWPDKRKTETYGFQYPLSIKNCHQNVHHYRCVCVCCLPRFYWCSSINTSSINNDNDNDDNGGSDEVHFEHSIRMIYELMVEEKNNYSVFVVVHGFSIILFNNFFYPKRK